MTQQDGRAVEMTEAEFVSIAGPRVLLGEPGAGKSDTAAEIGQISGGISVHAELLASGARLPELVGKSVIIDGVDEVLVGGADDPISTILNRLSDDDVQDFVLTCRAMDWQHATAEGKIARRFQTKPVVGQLQALNDDEMAAMVDAFSGAEGNGATFVRNAEAHGATELARNPQSLKLLLEATEEGGWPKTRLELYQRACLRLTREASREHQSLRPDRPSGERIMKAAGFVFAQLLLAGKRGVATDGQFDSYYPRAADLQGDHVSPEEIDAAIGSSLMRVASAQTLETCHRTVAEFLAAKWLAEALSNGVSLRRLETLLYAAGTTTVPTSLRGVHAWLAVLDVADAKAFIDADPYGVLRYGDAGSLADDQIRQLLRALPKLAQKDPLFRSEDWNLDVGKALARPSLQDEIVALIADKNASYHLTTVILESVRGTDLAGRIREQLRAFALDLEETYVERMRAVEAAVEGSADAFIVALVADLIAQKDRSSTRLALETMDDRPAAFSGEAIAQAFAAYYKAERSRSIVGVGYRIVRDLSPSQLREFIETLVPHLPKDRYASSQYSREVEEKVLDGVEAYLRSGASATANDIWNWLGRTGGKAYRDAEWSKFTEAYFGERPDLRRAVQAAAFAKAKTAGDAWTVAFEFGRIASGLALKPDDVVHHLDALLAKNKRRKDWSERWLYLFRWANILDGATGPAVQHARAQAQLHAELQALVDEIDNQGEPQHQIDERERQAKIAVEEERSTRSRWASFTKRKANIASGQDLYGLNTITHAYFGWYSDLDNAAAPLERIEQLVGNDSVKAALDGLRAVRTRNDIPTVRAGSELRAKNKQTYLLELIAIASCALHLEEEGDLTTLSRTLMESALAGLDWGLFSSEGSKLAELEIKLRALVFDTTENTEAFVRDALEPFLEAKTNSVSGIYKVTRETEFVGLLGPLSLDWLQRFPDVPAEILGYILDAAVRHGDQGAVCNLVAERLAKADWPTEEHRQLWYGAAFALDFDRFRSELDTFAAEKREHLWTFRHADSRERYEVEVEPIRDISRIMFLLMHFGSKFQLVEMPDEGWGGNSDYDGAQFVTSLLNRLGSIPTEEAKAALLEAIGEGGLGNHLLHAQHVVALQERQLAEVSWGVRTLEDVRDILQDGNPGSIDDLQAFVMDELAMLQRELQDGTTEAVETYWNGAVPHEENYCRHRIIDGIHHRLERRKVRVLPETAMPDNNRCDILCVSGAMDLPVEVKGQWHTEVWNAAALQLEDNYVREYRAEGRGVFLVIWFGYVPRYNPPQLGGKARPESADDMLRLLPQFSPRPINGKTKLFVLDVSRPKKKQEKVEAVMKKKAEKNKVKKTG